MIGIVAAVDASESVGDDAGSADGDVELVFRRWKIVPLTGEGLINGRLSRVFEPARGLWLKVAVLGDWGSGFATPLRAMGVSSARIGDGSGGRGCDSRFGSRCELRDLGRPSGPTDGGESVSP